MSDAVLTEPAAPAPASSTAPTGLTAEQVAQRVREGHTNATPAQTSRSLRSIVRANVFTFFNGLLAALFAGVVVTGRWQNGLFGLVIVTNAVIGIGQEWRAKRTLDRLAVLTAPRARVVRDGRVEEAAVPDVVLDDLVEVRTGDQVVADGVVRTAAGLEVDESLLTGESEAVPKTPGDRLLSGSIVVAGSGRMQAVAVGPDAYASRLTAEARRFSLSRSELISATNRLLRWISIVMLVVMPLLIWSQIRSADNHGWRDVVTSTVAALIGMVPEGLVLLTSLAFLLAALTLARHSTLIQQLPAVETLARVDVVCADKTGTLTHPGIHLDEVLPLAGAAAEDVTAALGLLSRTGEENATSAAIAEVVASSPWRAAWAVPFSSARKWAAVAADGHGTWILGAPEMVLRRVPGSPAAARANDLAAAGRRVLLLASSPAAVEPAPGEADDLLGDLLPQALVVLSETIREDAAATLRYFTDEGVAVKVISGDNPRTVGAIATRLQLPGVTAPADAVDARRLPVEDDALRAEAERRSVFGRTTPAQKRALIRGLRADGHVVAMTGDGVNDALAMKDADLGIAMGGGAAATRAVAHAILLDGRFAHLPEVLAEGRRVVANVERAANLFVVKNSYSLLLALIVAVTGAAYPFAPIQLTLISVLTIGVPGMVLALAPNTRRYEPGFLQRVLRFSLPVGAVIGTTGYAAYAFTRAVESGSSVDAGRTTATLAVLTVSLYTVLVLARPLTGWKLGLVGALIATAVLILSIPALAHGLFLLDLTPARALTAVLLGVAGSVLVELTHRGVARLARPRPRRAVTR